MPTYEFVCPNGHTFDKFFRTMSAAPSEMACPTCQALATRKVSGGAGLLFKGSGFYITDYGKDGKKGSARASSSTPSKSDSSSSNGSSPNSTPPASPSKDAAPKSSDSK